LVAGIVTFNILRILFRRGVWYENKRSKSSLWYSLCCLW
jgi:hypothetical protein